MKFYIKFYPPRSNNSNAYLMFRVNRYNSDLTRNVNKALNFKSTLEAENYLVKHNYRSKIFKSSTFKIMSEVEVVIDQL
jgi:hypothetical protein